MKNCWLLGVVGALIVLSGCGRPPSDPNTITVWHWMSDRHDVFVELARQYQQETGTTVDFQLFAPSEIYSQKITAAAQARILPDIFGVLDKKSVLGEFIKGGFVADLTAEFDADHQQWRGWFFEKALAAGAFEEGNPFGVAPGVYGVPLDVMTIQMVYNRRMLQEAGVTEVPDTFDAFLEAAQAVREMGVVPLVSGWSEPWLLDCFASNYAFNIMGKDKVMATYRGDVPYTDPDWVQVFSLFQVMAEKGVVTSGIVIKSNKFAEQDFAMERAAFAFNGSWCVNVYSGMNPNLDYGVMMPPVFSHKHPLMIWGGAGSSLMVNAVSPNKDKAAAFLKWLTDEPRQSFLAEATKNLPANRWALADLPEQFSDFGGVMDFVTHPTMWPEEEDAVVKERFVKALQALIIGEKTPQQAADEVQKVKARQMERARKRSGGR